MKRFFLALALFTAAVATMAAADMTQVWGQIKETKGFFVDKVNDDKAHANGFTDLLTAINTAPTSADIKNVNNLLATIERNQKITTVSQQGIKISIYMAPASQDGKLFKLLMAVEKDDNADKLLAVLYGTCTQEGMLKAIQSMSLVDIIGG